MADVAPDRNLEIQVASDDAHDDDDHIADQHSPLIETNHDEARDRDHVDSDDIPQEVDAAQSTYKQCLARMDKLDKKLSSYIFRWSPGKVMDVLITIPCLAFSYFGFPVWIVIYIIILESFLYAICVLVSIVVTQIMKRCFKRRRPKISDLGQRWFYLAFEDVSAEHSFPSGDTSQSAVFAVTLGYSINKYYFLGLLCVTPLVALGRVYFGRHYIGDTVGGALTGIVVGYCVNYFLVHHMYQVSYYTSFDV
eukprot:CAMPEP_0197036290 /NCGR_PEP_ID=MMETSP1384-20130603/13846_1 /TAXON_ID=29189 /ORGANISM="Ammonia sp." /LENGTH=250 /DNA_ID=CAMNT_0042466457 /DNA_START=31 /DNA_END=783 /DNA_ORIENTATION=+